MKLTQNTILVAPSSLVALVAMTGTAQATCPYTGAEQVFRPRGDQHNYVLAPDGGFEAGGSGWSLRGGAQVIEGNESHYANEPSDSRSLSLPPSSSAVSPPICMSLDTPLLRMFARNTGEGSSRLRARPTTSCSAWSGPRRSASSPPARTGRPRSRCRPSSPSLDDRRHADPERDPGPDHAAALEGPRHLEAEAASPNQALAAAQETQSAPRSAVRLTKLETFVFILTNRDKSIIRSIARWLGQQGKGEACTCLLDLPTPTSNLA